MTVNLVFPSQLCIMLKLHIWRGFGWGSEPIWSFYGSPYLLHMCNVKVFQLSCRVLCPSPFSLKSQTLRLGQFGQINFGAFSANLSAPILVLWVPCPCFPLINHYFYKKLSLYIQIPNIYLGLGFEFGPQRIWDLAIVCP